MSLFGPSKEAKAAHAAIGKRWKRAQERLGKCSGQAPYGEGTRSQRALKFIPTMNKAYAPYRDSDVNDFDDQAIGAWQADVYRVEQELIDMGCADGVKGSAAQSANADPLPTYDAEREGSEFFKGAVKVDQAATEAEKAGKSTWESVPYGVKVFGAVAALSWLASNVARILGR